MNIKNFLQKIQATNSVKEIKITGDAFYIRRLSVAEAQAYQEAESQERIAKLLAAGVCNEHGESVLDADDMAMVNGAEDKALGELVGAVIDYSFGADDPKD